MRENMLCKCLAEVGGRALNILNLTGGKIHSRLGHAERRVINQSSVKFYQFDSLIRYSFECVWFFFSWYTQLLVFAMKNLQTVMELHEASIFLLISTSNQLLLLSFPSFFPF